MLKERGKPLDVERTAQILGKGKSTVYELLNTGELKGANLGAKKGVTIFESDINDFIERRMSEFNQ